jgi:DNA helicase-2/ATP-dependent DNA helicase PcrA
MPPLKEFVALIRKYGEKLSRRGFSEAARELVREVGLFDEARRGAQGLPAQARRIEAMESLLRQLIEYEKREEQRAAEKALQPEARGLRPEALEDGDDEPFASGLPGYLMRLALDSKEADGDAGDCVTLMTLHGAKGLEWRCVFLTGLEEGLLPHSGRGFDDASGEPQADGAIDLEEERRLCYVGLTRARERLILTRAAQRVTRGKPIPRTPSRFLEDIPAELIDVIDLAGPQAESAKEVQQLKAKNFFAAMGNLLADEPPAE